MSRDPGVPYGSGPGQAAADAEPLRETTTPPAGGPSSTAGGAWSAAGVWSAVQERPYAIPGIPEDRPELHVTAAFAGGLLLATLLKRLAR